MDVELTSTAWVLRIPVKSNYTAREVARILGSNVAWIRAQERFLGPASTDAHPVDHDALAQFIKERARRQQRVRARALLRAVLEQHLED